LAERGEREKRRKCDQIINVLCRFAIGQAAKAPEERNICRMQRFATVKGASNLLI